LPDRRRHGACGIRRRQLGLGSRLVAHPPPGPPARSLRPKASPPLTCRSGSQRPPRRRRHRRRRRAARRRPRPFRRGSMLVTHLACKAGPSPVNWALTRRARLMRQQLVRTADAPLRVTSKSRHRRRRAWPSPGWALAARGRGLDGRRWAVCVSCGAPFRPRRRDAWFCSRRCQRSALRARSTTRRCLWCRQQISNSRAGTARFCSDRCRKRAWRDAAGDGGAPA
jgi:hypothetical protein